MPKQTIANAVLMFAGPRLVQTAKAANIEEAQQRLDARAAMKPSASRPTVDRAVWIDGTFTKDDTSNRTTITPTPKENHDG